VLRDNLARFRELLRSRHVPKVRQVLRKLLGDGDVLWFEPQEGGGYELTGDTRLGSLFNSSGAQESLRELHPVRIKLT
jgi:hypothetical protein